MPTRKIADPKKEDICRHPEHNVPTHQYFTPGTYEHSCPGYGRRFIFTVNGVTY